MNALSLRPPGDTQRYIQSVALSLLIHGLAVAAGLSLLGHLHLAPQPEPFTWEVSVVEAPTPEQGHESGLSPTPLAPSPTKTQSVESQRATQPIQTVQPMDVSQQTATSTTEAVPFTSPRTLAQPAEAITDTETSRSVSQPVITNTAPPHFSDQSAISSQVVEAPQAQPIERAKPEITEGTMKSAATPVIQEAAVREYPGQPSPAAKPDYGWLAQALWNRIEQLKRYPYFARMNRWEGKVVLRAVIKEDGQLMHLEVAESSGHSVLDLDALEIMRQASPLKLKHALGQPQVVVQVPISYRLER